MPCFPSLARSEKNLLRLAGEVARRVGGVSHPRIIPQGEQNGHYGHVSVRPSPPLRGSSPCEAGQFILAGLDSRQLQIPRDRKCCTRGLTLPPVIQIGTAFARKGTPFCNSICFCILQSKRCVLCFVWLRLILIGCIDLRN